MIYEREQTEYWRGHWGNHTRLTTAHSQCQLVGRTMLSKLLEPQANFCSPERMPSANNEESQLNVLHEYGVYFLQNVQPKENQTNWDK